MDRENWLMNPYKSIVDMCELSIMRGGTVTGTLKSLEAMFSDSEHEIVKQRIARVTELVKAEPTRNISNYLVQGLIIKHLKEKLAGEKN